MARMIHTPTPRNIKSLINRNALFVVNHSGGKDSQAMMARIVKFVPSSQILVVHAELPGVEWGGVRQARSHTGRTVKE
jgi:hypothetical protein